MNRVNIASVKFNKWDKQTYYYECPLKDVVVGDYVNVNVYGESKIVEVVKLEQFNQDATPYPVNQLKKILSKCDETVISKKKDPIKVAFTELDNKKTEIQELFKTQKLLYPFEVDMGKEDKKDLVEVFNEYFNNKQSIVGQTMTTKAPIHCRPQVFENSINQILSLVAFTSEDEVGKLKNTASFLPMSLDSMIKFSCKHLPYITKIIVNPWSDNWVIPVITKIDISVTIKENMGDIKVAQGITIKRDGIESLTTVHDKDEREQDWNLSAKADSKYTEWFHNMVGLACYAMNEKQSTKPEESEIGIYYFYGNDNFEYIPFAAEFLPDSVKEICRRISTLVPDDLYLTLTKYKIV